MSKSKKVKKAVSIGVSFAIAIGLVSCAGGGASKPAVVIEGKGKAALISYTLDKSIVKSGESRDQGPGLLSKLAKGNDNAENDHFKDQIDALNGMYEQFSSQIKEVFVNVPFVETSVVTGNEFYQNETKHVPKMVMGKDVNQGRNYLTVNNLNYVSVYDTTKLRKIAEELKVELLLMVHNSAEYDLGTGVKVNIGGLGGGAAKLKLKTQIFVYDPRAGLILNWTDTNLSEENMPMVNGYVNSARFPKCSLSAQQKALNNFKAYLEAQKQKAQQQSSTGS